METGRWYQSFAELEAAGSSSSYARLALTVSTSPSTLRLLESLPVAKRQPNLLFAAARVAGAPTHDARAFVGFVESAWDTISSIMRGRSTQTNEAARTGTFLPILAAIEGPMALIEVGCSAGVCLYPDRYAISYDRRRPLVPESPVWIEVATSGPVVIPRRPPDIVARIGIDLNPIDASNADDCAWLEALVWPEHEARRRRLRAALAVVRDDPPSLLRGDLIERFTESLALVPAGVTPVVFHSAVLNYVSTDMRRRFAELVHERPGVVWLSNEGPGVIAGLTTDLTPPAFAPSPAFFITARSGSNIVGISDPHGTWIRW